MPYDDDDDEPELTDLLPLSFAPLHEDLWSRRSRFNRNFDYAYLVLVPPASDDQEDE